MFNKNIDCDDIAYSYIVYRDTTKKMLYYNHNIVVSPDINGVVVCKNRVCDILPVGKYKVTSAALPNTFKRINFEKHEKKYHAPIHKFRAEVYFVNMRERLDFQFSSDEAFFFKNTKFGKVFGYVEGLCNIGVIDPEALAKALLYGEKDIDIMKVNDNIGLWIGNEINKRLEKSKIKFEDMLLNHRLIDEYINRVIVDAFDKIGFVVNDVRIKAFRMAPKVQKKVNEFIATHKAILKNVKLTNTKATDTMTVNIGNRSSMANGSRNVGTLTISSASSNLPRCKHCGNILKSTICTKCGAKYR